MINNKRSLLLLNLLVSACTLSGLSYADGIGSNKSWYVGGSIGQSTLDPDVSGTNWKSTDDSDVSKNVYVGKDLNNQFGLEAFWSDYGSASFKSTSGGKGEISYKGYGANMIYNSPYQFGGLRPFGKLGVARIVTEDNHDIKSKQINKTSVFAGVGVEHELSDRLNLRAEYNYIDKDISNLNVGLNWSPNYRIHNHSRIKPPVIKKVVKKAKPAPKPKIVYVPKKVYVKKPVPKPKPQYQVMHRNLTGGSNFSTGSSRLTFVGQNTLNRLVSDIKNQRITVKSIRVVGHTDSVGTRQSNYYLSMNRANSVANYLASQGIDRRQIQTMGRGELQPIASNKNSYGKAKNRRVEIAIYGTSRIKIK